jgi:hypothetical protein
MNDVPSAEMSRSRDSGTSQPSIPRFARRASLSLTYQNTKTIITVFGNSLPGEDSQIYCLKARHPPGTRSIGQDTGNRP